MAPWKSHEVLIVATAFGDEKRTHSARTKFKLYAENNLLSCHMNGPEFFPQKYRNTNKTVIDQMTDQESNLEKLPVRA